MITILHILGVPTFLWGLFANIGTWKGDILALLAVAYAGWRLGVLVWKSLQDIREREIELRAKKKRYEKDSK